jgi:hypothetical protein
MTSLFNRLNTFLLILLVLMAAAIIAILATRASAGPLDPPAAPASTNRSLIFQPASCGGFPITISQPGSYALASNITMPVGCTFKNGITITTSNVTLDLNGFSVIGLASNSGTGIYAGSGTMGLRVTNGTVSTWSSDGIDFTNAERSAIDHVTAYGSTSASGIGLGTASTLSDCVAIANNSGVALLGHDSTVTRCNLSDNGTNGLFVAATSYNSRIEGNHAADNTTAFNIHGYENDIEDNTAIGYYIVTSSGFVGDPTTGLSNRVFHNVAANVNPSSAFSFPVTNDVGPVGAASSVTSPWANIVE